MITFRVERVITFTGMRNFHYGGRRYTFDAFVGAALSRGSLVSNPDMFISLDRQLPDETAFSSTFGFTAAFGAAPLPPLPLRSPA